MATKKQKQELIEILKFTPVTVRLMIQGYGGESYAGTVDRKIYEFFKKNQYDLEEFASDWDGEWNDKVPAELQPFNPGSPYDCDNLWHASGAELSDLNLITVEEVDSNKELWNHNAGYSDLEESGVTVVESGGTELCELDNGTVVFWGGQGEKGCFFDGEFELRAPFDPKKLTVYYENCDDWYIISSVEYDGEEIDGSGGYSTTGKWAENKWIIVGDEEVYDAVPLDEREEVSEEELEEDSGEWDPIAESDKIWEASKSDWFDITVNPERKGNYECEFESTTWPFPIERLCEWTGRSWKENGKKAVGIKRWRGLKFNPKDL